MKKLIIATIGLASALTTFGQGVIYFDGTANSSQSSSATSGGLVFINGVLDTGTDINAELIFGTSAGAVSSANIVSTLLLSASTPNFTTPQPIGAVQPASADITAFNNGQLYDNAGVAYQFSSLAAGTVVYFQVLGWLGNYDSYAAAVTGGANVGFSSVFAETLTSSTGATVGIDQMSALNLVSVPEPTTLALAGFGGFGMLMALRRKQA
jgi:hypothetical protein